MQDEIDARREPRRDFPACYVDDLWVWGGRVLGVMTLAAFVLWIVEGF